MDCFGRIYDSPRNDERVERLYFLRKQKEAKTFSGFAHFFVIARRIVDSPKQPKSHKT